MARGTLAEAARADHLMKRGELLLQWLTHVGEGSWNTFRRALSAVYAPEDDHDPALARRMRACLSDLGHVQFFIAGGNRWRTFAPLLGGVRETTRAVLSGGRNDRLIESLAQASGNQGCHVESSEVTDGLDSIQVVGPAESFGRVAEGAGLRYVSDLVLALCADVEPIESVLASATSGAAPANWSVRSFDLGLLSWVDGLLPHAAYEYSSRYGARRYYVRGPKASLLRLDKRKAVYAAAHLNRVPLLSYDEREHRLVVPMGAPLPDEMARAAAASRGALAAVEFGHFVYEGVRPTVAGVLMVAAGQPPPEPYWISKRRRAG